MWQSCAGLNESELQSIYGAYSGILVLLLCSIFILDKAESSLMILPFITIIRGFLFISCMFYSAG